VPQDRCALLCHARLCAHAHTDKELYQNFIFFAISNYGSLVNITITTTRKVCARAFSGIGCDSPSTGVATQFFSVLCSVFYNKSYLRSGQWSGVVLVFVGLGKSVAHRCGAVFGH